MAKVGTSFIDITDLTQTLPLTLMLETNKEQNVQTKMGELYSPNFEKEGEELIITPSFFVGQKEILPFPVDCIRYQVGEKENNIEKDFQYIPDINKRDPNIYVDEKGYLHYKKNLQKQLTIEARIEGYKHKDESTVSSVNASNPKTILLLEQGSNLYNLVITSKDGREHFEEDKQEAIELTATLYKGTEEVKNNVYYKWDIVTDTDTPETEDDFSVPSQSGTDFISEEQTITIPRNWVSTLEVFQCTATLADGSNLKFEAQKIIRDFIDNFSATIISDKARILNPENSEITLINNIYHLGNLVTDTSRITSYSWFLFYKDQEEKLIQEGTSNTLVINLNAEEKTFPKEDFSILCVALIDGKERVVAYTDIIYRETFYRPVVSPKTIFVPVNNNGTPVSETFSHEIKFQLVDDGNNILNYIEQTSISPSLKKKDNSSFGYISQTEGKWEFKIPFSLDLSNNNDLWTSNLNFKIYEFDYTYLNQPFTEEFEIVKNYAGRDGEQGFSGYTIDLSNEFHAFAGGEMHADANQEVICGIDAYFGDQKREIQEIAIGETIIYSKAEPLTYPITYELSNSGGAFLISCSAGIENEPQIKVSLTTGSENNFITKIEPLNFYITILDQNNNSKTFFKTFSYTINYYGKSYRLNLSSNNIKYSEPTNEYTPSQITVSATTLETSGAINNYSAGKIIYSLDNGETWKYYTNPISNYSALKNIIVRLYSSLATDINNSANLTTTLLSSNEKYLLDMETIPILTSMEGYEIGGENLIKWSKELPVEANKWSFYKTGQSIGTDGDFSTIDFNSSEKVTNFYQGFISSKINFTQDYKDKTFCFSCYIYSEDWSTFADDEDQISFCIAGHDDSFKEQSRYGVIGSICPKKDSSMFLEKDLVNLEWIKVYKIFKLNDNFFEFPKEANETLEQKKIAFDKFSHIDFRIYNIKNGKCKIKKPKLELGNVPTAWSASPYDITSYDIFGDNLINNDAIKYPITQIESPKTVIGGLKNNTYYTLSWKEIETTLNSPKITFEILREEDSSVFIRQEVNTSIQNYSYTFQTEEGSYELRLYAGLINNLIPGEFFYIKEFKLEEGQTASSFLMSSIQLQQLLDEVENNLVNQIDEKTSISYEMNEGIPTLTLPNKETISFTDYNDFQKMIDNLNNTKVELEKTINGITLSTLGASDYNSLQNTIETYESHIKVEIDENNPYIELKASSIDYSEWIRLTKNSLDFYSGSSNEPVASLKSSKLFITQADFTTQLRIGKPVTENDGLGFLVFRQADNGVIVLWENN